AGHRGGPGCVKITGVTPRTGWRLPRHQATFTGESFMRDHKRVRPGVGGHGHRDRRAAAGASASRWLVVLCVLVVAGGCNTQPRRQVDVELPTIDESLMASVTARYREQFTLPWG